MTNDKILDRLIVGIWFLRIRRHYAVFNTLETGRLFPSLKEVMLLTAFKSFHNGHYEA
jgi:hypothetical protein